MKITLYLDNKIIEFELPNEIEGSFSFDEDPKSDSKLINIEAVEGKWVLYSTPDSSVLNGTEPIMSIPIKNNSFYNIKKDNQIYLIFISNSKENSILSYKYDQNINIVLGNDDTCNIRYNNNFINKAILNIKYEENQLMLNVLSEDKVYQNNKQIKTGKSVINNGDTISTYGVNILVLKDILLISNPQNLLTIQEANAGINYYNIPVDNQKNTEEVKDRELYPEEMFFSKSPRIRRFITTKEIKIDPPPQNQQQEDLPFLLTIGPMITMGTSSLMMLVNTIMQVNSGNRAFSDSWPQLLTSAMMLVSTLVWPSITKWYSNKKKKRDEKTTIEKYNKYLQGKELELQEESKLQQTILVENLITLQDCIDMINKRGTLFWNKRNDENDFLKVRVGTGDEELDVEINWPEEGFTIEEDAQKKAAEAVIEKYKYIRQVPIGYSLYENSITAVMGPDEKSYNFVNNMILQLLTFYSYEDIKLVFFTTKENKFYFEYGKYLKHTFSNDMSYRFFATTPDDYQTIAEYLNMEINNRIPKDNNNEIKYKPHYIIIADNYEDIKKYEFVNTIAESEVNLGFSVILIEDRLSKLPSKCNNFISLSGNQAGILQNSFEEQKHKMFNEEINYQINMMNITKVLSNIPIEFEDGLKYLPDSITFLEMERVGKVEQLNILNRWKTNDPTSNLKAEIGVDELGSTLYLDLHEKAHGPHGLIAGTTGSGKSEFIITYVLSMCMNYSPDYVSFILIDYKGGGLAGAFENKLQGIVLPHLAGTITNLDKAEMDRTLVSIDSEAKRRQRVFNEARDRLGESTMDIYKYQAFYRDGKVEEPLPHLFIICDEFAELKSQQPEFMDNLISIARIGRSLGVHLILATQKPSGVVNDQIWSNSKFKVCLKVQTEADSKEMLKRPEAAYIKQAGRFYLQVGYDEYFVQGQSGWCGAKYYPSNQIVKEVDKSVNFIGDCGNFIKSIKADTGQKATAQGEQLPAILNNIIETAKKENLRSRKLWLDNIPEKIYIDEIEKKYNITSTPYDIKAIIGEYDAPENQEQGIVIQDILEDGNTLIYGLDSEEKEMLLNSIIYSTTKNHTADEINIYITDYGSETLRIFNKLPQIGGIVYQGEDEKFNNLIKLINEEIQTRKKLFADYGGDYKNYLKSSGQKLPVKLFIFNNYPSIQEAYEDIGFNILPTLTRDSERYGIVFILTTTTDNSVGGKTTQNFKKIYSFKLKTDIDYKILFNCKKKIYPRDILGRGLYKTDDVHEFQTALIVNQEQDLNEFMRIFVETQKQKSNAVAKKIPTLPDIVRFNDIKSEIKDIENIPVGISKKDLEIAKYNTTIATGIVISSSKLSNTNKFLASLCVVLRYTPNTETILIDTSTKLENLKSIIPNYYNNNLDKLLPMLKEYYNKKIEDTNNQVLIIYGISKLIDNLENPKELEDFLKEFSKNQKAKIIIVEDQNKLKTYAIEVWYRSNFSSNDGIWIGKGVSDQGIIKIGQIKKEHMQDIKNNFGYVINDGTANLTKFIDFITKDGEENEE